MESKLMHLFEFSTNVKKETVQSEKRMDGSNLSLIDRLLA
jgi:hypothetical protein